MGLRPKKPLSDESVLPPSEAVNCPRCDSSETKFCYYNNYNRSQPRYFCRACKRHWTRGGVLRNVPIGGGVRKPRHPKKSGGRRRITTTAINNDDDSAFKADVNGMPSQGSLSGPARIFPYQMKASLTFKPDHNSSSHDTPMTTNGSSRPGPNPTFVLDFDREDFWNLDEFDPLSWDYALDFINNAHHP